MTATNVSRDWCTFLPLPDPSKMDRPLTLDPNWCVPRGVNPESEIVLRLIKDQVLPLIRWLEKRHGLKSFHFLVHNRQSGVPTVESDLRAFVHLRLFFNKPKTDFERVLKGVPAFRVFELTRPNDERKDAFAGLNPNIIVDPGGFDFAWGLLDAQAKWVLRLVEGHEWKDGVDIVRQVAQYLHFFANMTQLSIR